MNTKMYCAIFAFIIFFFIQKSKKNEHFGTDFFHRGKLKDRVRQYDLLQNRSFMYPNHCQFFNCNKEKCPHNNWICKSHAHRFNPANME